MLLIDIMFSFQQHLQPKKLQTVFFFSNPLISFIPTNNPGGFLIFVELLKQKLLRTKKIEIESGN